MKAPLVIAAVLGGFVAACGDGGDPGEAYECVDGSTLEVLRPDTPDESGNVARARLVGPDGDLLDDIGRVDASTLAGLLDSCTG